MIGDNSNGFKFLIMNEEEQTAAIIKDFTIDLLNEVDKLVKRDGKEKLKELLNK